MVLIECVCALCGNQCFKTPKDKRRSKRDFCSKKCALEQLRMDKTKDVNAECSICFKAIHVEPCKIGVYRTFHCNGTECKKQHKINYEINKKTKDETKHGIFNCLNCDNKVSKQLSNINGNIFCSKSCRCRYNNLRRTWNSSRSKFELLVESKLGELYNTLEVLYCDNKTIGSELDIYIPSLKVAIEINGPTHYEPIYGEEVLARTLRSDTKKITNCNELGIKLYHIDMRKINMDHTTKINEKLQEIYEIIDSNMK